MRPKRIFKLIGWTFIVLFLVANIIAAMQAYHFTHFASSDVVKTKDAKKLSFFDKAKVTLLGISNPRPVNRSVPSQSYTTLQLKSNKTIECWYIATPNSRGTVVLFHGYSGDKATMLDKSDIFIGMGYNVLLVDFMGCGGSGGNQTTVGYKEATEVASSFDYLVQRGEKNIYLFGTSMGASAVLKAMNDYHLKPTGIILECPFGSLYQTTAARFKTMRLPAFPLAGMLLFWGGMENGFWAFGYKPAEYAKTVDCPALLLYGGSDEKVSKDETYEIFMNLQGPKQLKIYPLAAHENYLVKYHDQWVADVDSFLRRN